MEKIVYNSNQEKEHQEKTDSDSIDKNELPQVLFNIKEQNQIMEQLIHNQIVIKDEMIDRLYKELDYYKQGSEDRFVNQLMKAVIKIRKDMTRIISSEKWENMSLEDIKREYQYISEDITDLLEQQNVDCYQSKPGDNFDAAIHHPKPEYTSDKSMDKKIKESISEGYKKGDKVLIAERVIVYQFKA